MPDGMYILMEELKELREKVLLSCELSLFVTLTTEIEVEIVLKFSFDREWLVPDFIQRILINPKDTRYTRFEGMIKKFMDIAIANVNQYIKKERQSSSIKEEI